MFYVIPGTENDLVPVIRMNTCTDLIPRYELQIDCRDVGQSVVAEVMDCGPDITDQRMDEIFEPLIDSFETRTRDAVIKEMDELQGQAEDRREEEQHIQLVQERRADILDLMILSINDDLVEYTDGWIMEQTGFSSSWDLDNVDDDEILEYPVDDEHWDDYRTSYHLDFEDDAHLLRIFRMLQNSDEDQIIPYMQAQRLDVWDIPSYIDKLQDKGVDTHRANTLVTYINQLRQLRVPVGAGVGVGAAAAPVCQMVIKSGSRKGVICGRTVRGRGKCSYHFHRSEN
jgi:hypothetical protein